MSGNDHYPISFFIAHWHCHGDEETMIRTKERLRDRLNKIVLSMRADLDRVEILAAALSAFSKPVPEYRPEFRHLDPQRQSLARFEIPS